MPAKYPTPSPAMQIPDTPEQLFELLAEPTLRDLYPTFDELSSPNQKLVRVLHTELAKGTLSDGTFQEFLGFVLLLWRSFNAGAMARMDHDLETNDDIDADWIPAATSFHRMDQYLTSLLALLDAMPPEDGANPLSAWSHYYLRTSAD